MKSMSSITFPQPFLCVAVNSLSDYNHKQYEMKQIYFKTHRLRFALSIALLSLLFVWALIIPSHASAQIESPTHYSSAR